MAFVGGCFIVDNCWCRVEEEGYLSIDSKLCNCVEPQVPCINEGLLRKCNAPKADLLESLSKYNRSL